MTLYVCLLFEKLPVLGGRRFAPEASRRLATGDVRTAETGGLCGRLA